MRLESSDLPIHPNMRLKSSDFPIKAWQATLTNHGEIEKPKGSKISQHPHRMKHEVRGWEHLLLLEGIAVGIPS